MADLMANLTTILARIQQDQFGGRDAPQVSASAHTAVDHTGCMSGELSVSIKKKNGEFAIIETWPLASIRTTVELEGALAELLSRVLAIHHKWPR